MAHSATWLTSAAVIALTLGVTSRADDPPKKEAPPPLGSIIIAANLNAPSAAQFNAANN